MKRIGVATMAALAALLAGAAGCDRLPSQKQASAPARAPASPAEKLAQGIDQAPFAPPPATPAASETSASETSASQTAANQTAAANPAEPAYTPSLLKLQVWLDRARFSPGVIDGHFGENVQHAIAAYQRANGMDPDGMLTQALWAKLAQADAKPVMRLYRIDPADVAGPFTPNIPTDMAAMSELDSLGYRGPSEALAEMFHMDEDLLKALNPGVDFGKAGTVILVADRGDDDAGVEVVRVEVDKKLAQVRAYAVDDRLVAAYPATIGSASRPAPSGDLKINGVAPQPTYLFDSDRLSFGGNKRRKFEIAAGPNNPVGAVWIDLSKDTYGIHGTPEPSQVGKTASHGCVRLTNWDARELARGVKTGVDVKFE